MSVLTTVSERAVVLTKLSDWPYQWGGGRGEGRRGYSSAHSRTAWANSAMINLQWGSSPASQVIFVNQPPECFNVPDENAGLDAERQLIILLEYFPVLSDLLTKFSVDCLCSDCSVPGSNRLRLGCLKRTAIDEVFLLLAHGVADGFRARNSSSISNASPIVEGMTALLMELVQDQKVCWDT